MTDYDDDDDDLGLRARRLLGHMAPMWQITSWLREVFKNHEVGTEIDYMRANLRINQRCAPVDP